MGEDRTGGRLRIAELARGRSHGFDHKPDEAELAALREALGLLGLRKVRMSGEIAPLGKQDWSLAAKLGATVQQPCVVTLEPVTTRIDVPVARRFLANWQEPEGTETEIPQDDAAEPMPGVLDLAALLAEELALALPLYPRTEGVEFDEPDPAADDEDRVHPFAGLAALKARIEGEDGA